MVPLSAVLALVLTAPANPPPPPPSSHIVKVMAKGDGASAETAYKVSSVKDEYEIVRVLGLEVKSQSLVVRKKPYDVLEVVDPRDGRSRELWFDIGSFYPELDF